MAAWGDLIFLEFENGDEVENFLLISNPVNFVFANNLSFEHKLLRQMSWSDVYSVNKIVNMSWAIGLHFIFDILTNNFVANKTLIS